MSELRDAISDCVDTSSNAAAYRTADEVLAMPELAAIRKALADRFVPRNPAGAADERSRQRGAVFMAAAGLPASVVAWVLEVWPTSGGDREETFDMSERLTDEQVAWYAGTSRTAKWTADMAVHENIITLAREVQAHRTACECAPIAEYPHELFCPSIDVCAFCSDSECDGIGCITDLDPDDIDDHPRLEQIQAWVRLGRIQEQANAFLAIVENRA